MPSTQLIKQIAAGRRRPNLTRKEYFDHRFRIHGEISDAIEDKNQKPHKYIQTQVFDSVFGARAGGPLNANHNWCGRDDTTELYFRDWDHVLKCFTCNYVKEKVGPDGVFFADFETTIILMAYEKTATVQTRLASERADRPLDRGDATVAMYFISTPSNELEGQQLETELTPLLTAAIEQYCQDDVWGCIINVGAKSDKFDLKKYFGGDSTMPEYCLVYKVLLKNRASAPVFRKSQRSFEAVAKQAIDPHRSFVLFSEEALIMDVGKNIRFSRDRQPVFEDLLGPSHLDT